MNIESAYNSWAEQYDSNPNATRDLDQKATIETLSKYAFKNVLELGCGTGKNTIWLLQRSEQIIGLDFSEEMLQIAKEKISNSNVTFKKMDLTKNWEVTPQFADLITSSLTLEHIEDLNHVFDQAHQKLQDDGIFFISELHPFKQYLGSKAKFQSNGETVYLETYIHHISNYMENAQNNGFVLVELKEWFDKESTGEIPRLITFVFRKTDH